MAEEKQAPDQEPTASETSRREFLKRLGGALGGVALAQSPLFAGGGGWGPGSGIGAPPLPNGFQFYRVFTLNGDNPFPFAPLKAVLPAVMLTERSQIIFHGINSSGARGVYALNMNYFQGGAPRVSSGVKLVEAGDTLPADGRPVHRIAVGDTNATGSYATVLGTDNPGTEFPPGRPTPNPGLAQNNWVPQSTAPAPTAPPITAGSVYIQKDPNSGLHPLVTLTSLTPALDQSGTQGQFGAIHGDLALQDDNSVLLSAHYSLYNKNTGPLGVAIGPEAYQGLFQLTGGTASDVGKLIQNTGDVLPQSGAILTAFGLVDVSPDGYYVAQAYAAHRGRGGGWGRGVGREALAPSVLINGHVDQHPSEALLLAASGELRPRGMVTVGDTILGPRVGPGNIVGHVTHLTDTAHRLTVQQGSNRTVVGQTGSALGGDISQAIGPPVVAPDGLTYYAQVVLDAQQNQVNQLYVSNGDPNTPPRLLLSSLDPVSSGGYVTEILFGYHTAQADSAGRIVFLGEFSATANPTTSDPITTSIVVGIPV